MGLKFTARNKLCTRTAKRAREYTVVNAEAVKLDYSHSGNMFYNSSIFNPIYAINMEGANVYFNGKPKSAVSLRGKKSISF